MESALQRVRVALVQADTGAHCVSGPVRAAVFGGVSDERTWRAGLEFASRCPIVPRQCDCGGGASGNGVDPPARLAGHGHASAGAKRPPHDGCSRAGRLPGHLVWLDVVARTLRHDRGIARGQSLHGALRNADHLELDLHRPARSLGAAPAAQRPQLWRAVDRAVRCDLGFIRGAHRRRPRR